MVLVTKKVKKMLIFKENKIMEEKNTKVVFNEWKSSKRKKIFKGIQIWNMIKRYFPKR